MDTRTFEWHQIDGFVGRRPELEFLERWWQEQSSTSLVVFGQEGAGKSWLVRRFAHQKEANVISCRRVSVGAQIQQIREKLSVPDSGTPPTNSLPTLIADLIEQSPKSRTLLVFDDFQWLLPTGESTIDEELTRLRKAIISRKTTSNLKIVFVVNDPTIADTMVAEKPSNSGVIQGIGVSSLSLSSAGSLLPSNDPFDRFTRLSITGGLTSRLSRLGDGDLDTRIIDEILTPDGSLWGAGEVPITTALREPRIYFSILEELASGDRLIAELSPRIHLDTGPTSKYLNTLETIGLVERRLPVGANPQSRNGHWRLKDGFLRFYFRFVFPHKEQLIDGRSPRELYDSEIASKLNGCVEVDFQDWATAWTRRSHSFIAPIAGPWWPSVKPDFRRKQSRRTEGLTLVGFDETQITMAGEAIWTDQPMGSDTVSDLRERRMLLLSGTGYEQEFPPILILFSKAGYSEELRDTARDDESLVLVDVGLEMNRESALR